MFEIEPNAVKDFAKIAALKIICEKHPEEIDAKFVCEIFGWEQGKVNKRNNKRGRAGLSEELVSSIKHDYIYGHLSELAIAKKYGVHINTVKKYVAGEPRISKTSVLSNDKVSEIIKRYKRHGMAPKIIAMETNTDPDLVRDTILDYIKEHPDERNEET